MSSLRIVRPSEMIRLAKRSGRVGIAPSRLNEIRREREYMRLCNKQLRLAETGEARNTEKQTALDAKFDELLRKHAQA